MNLLKSQRKMSHDHIILFLLKTAKKAHTSLLDVLLFMAFKRITKFTEPRSGIWKDNEGGMVLSKHSNQ